MLQNYQKILLDRAVIYLNVDLAVQGQASMRALGVPIVADLLYEVAKKVKEISCIILLFITVTPAVIVESVDHISQRPIEVKFYCESSTC
jgi:hypothetical protein